MDFDNNKIKHLEFIQNVITRMNQNSFQIKSLTIAIVAALLAIYADKGNMSFLIISFLPIVVFWALDAYYLRMERQYRGLYNNVAGLCEDYKRKSVTDWDMNASVFKDGNYGYCATFFSKSLILFYLGTATIVLTIIVFINI